MGGGGGGAPAGKAGAVARRSRVALRLPGKTSEEEARPRILSAVTPAAGEAGEPGPIRSQSGCEKSELSSRHPARSAAEMRDRRAVGVGADAPAEKAGATARRSRVALRLPGKTSGKAGATHVCRGCQWIPGRGCALPGMTSEEEAWPRIPSAVTPAAGEAGEPGPIHFQSGGEDAPPLPASSRTQRSGDAGSESRGGGGSAPAGKAGAAARRSRVAASPCPGRRQGEAGASSGHGGWPLLPTPIRRRGKKASSKLTFHVKFFDQSR